MIVIIAGPAGAGKTTIGRLLANQTGFVFADADSFHSDVNKEKMTNGIPLSDADRQPWLDSMRQAIATWIEEGTNVVLACSALKHSYRQKLRGGDDAVKFVFLEADPELLAKRLSNRANHFMKTQMLQSQLEDLEQCAADECLIVDAAMSPDALTASIRAALKI